MSGWLIFGIVIALFLLIGCIPVGVDAAYRDEQLALRLKIGFFPVQLLPQKQKKKKPAKKSPALKSAAEPEKTSTPEKTSAQDRSAAQGKKKKRVQMPKLTLSDIFSLLDLLGDTLGDLRRKLRVEVLVLHVHLDGSDAAKAAIGYGRMWAALGALTPKLDRLFVIKKRDIQPILDYNEKEMKIEAQLALTITIGRAISLALRAGVRFLKLWINKKKAVQHT